MLKNVFRETQFMKAPLPMVLREFDAMMETDSKDEQRKKAASPIETTEAGMVID